MISSVPLLGLIGILIAAFVTLVAGAVWGGIFTIAATLPYLITFYVTYTQPHDAAVLFPLSFGVGFAVLTNVLTWALALVLKWEKNWSILLQLTALFGVLVVSIIHLIYPEVATFWGETLTTSYQYAHHTLITFQPEPQNDLKQTTEAIQLFKYIATGIFVVCMLGNAIIQLIVASWWQNAVFKTANLQKALHHIRLTPLAGGLFIICLVFFYLGNPLVLDILPIPTVLFAAAGLSLIHYMAGLARSSLSWFLLAVFYVTLFGFMPRSTILIFLLALLGFADIWLDVRYRVKINNH